MKRRLRLDSGCLISGQRPGLAAVVSRKSSPVGSHDYRGVLICSRHAGETLARSWRVLKPGGRLITIAASAEQTDDEHVRNAFFIVEPNRSQLAVLAGLIDAGQLQPVEGAVFPIAKAPQAFEHKPARGKVVGGNYI